MSLLILLLMLAALAALTVGVTLPDLAPGNGRHVRPGGAVACRPHHHPAPRHARTDLVRTSHASR